MNIFEKRLQSCKSIKYIFIYMITNISIVNNTYNMRYVSRTKASIRKKLVMLCSSHENITISTIQYEYSRKTYKTNDVSIVAPPARESWPPLEHPLLNAHVLLFPLRTISRITVNYSKPKSKYPPLSPQISQLVARSRQSNGFTLRFHHQIL